MRASFRTALFGLCAGLLAMALPACSMTTPAPAWTYAQNAYVGLVTYEAAQQVALAVAKQPSLSAKEVAAVKAGEASATAGLVGAGQAYVAGGSGTAQALSGLSGAAAGAASSLQQLLSASGGGAGPNATALAEAAGISALGSLPAVIVAVEKVNGGYQPTAEDFTAVLKTIQAEDQLIQAVGAAAAS